MILLICESEKLYMIKEKIKYWSFNFDMLYRKLYIFFNYGIMIGIIEFDECWMKFIWEIVVFKCGIIFNFYWSSFLVWFVYWVFINRLDFKIIVVLLLKKFKLVYVVLFNYVMIW